jgi:transposase-like protein
MVLDHEGDHPSRWAAIVSIAAKIGCVPQTLHEWVKKVEVDSGKRAGVPTEMADRLKSLERENRELRQANEILRKASAYFAQAELDRPFNRFVWRRCRAGPAIPIAIGRGDRPHICGTVSGRVIPILEHRRRPCSASAPACRGRDGREAGQ